MNAGARILVQGLASIVLGLGTLVISGVELAVDQIADHPTAATAAAAAAGVPWAAGPAVGAAKSLREKRGKEKT